MLSDTLPTGGKNIGVLVVDTLCFFEKLTPIGTFCIDKLL